MRMFNRERRQHPRHSVDSNVRVSHASFGIVDANSRDISDRGVCIYSDQVPQLPKGAHINLQFLDSANPDLLFNTRVVRVYDQCIGLVIVDYEYNGQRFSLDTLREQWELASADVYT